MASPPPVRRWLVEAARRIDAALGPARVERLVLPPFAAKPDKEGEFCAVQLDDGSVGLAFTLLDGTLAALHGRQTPEIKGSDSLISNGSESTNQTPEIKGSKIKGSDSLIPKGPNALGALAANKESDPSIRDPSIRRRFFISTNSDSLEQLPATKESDPLIRSTSEPSSVPEASDPSIRDAWSRAGVPAMELVRGYAADDPAARAVGLATINALARRLYARAGFVPDDSTDSFGSLTLAPGDRLGMVGHFTSLIEQARALGVPVTVLELKPELVREEPGLVVTLDAKRLAGCNKFVSTSTLLLNDTFEQVSALWRGADAVAIVGPSAGCPPDPLFAAGVSSVGTAWVADADAFLAHVAAGEKWGASSKKVTLTPQRYPGLETLLARA